MTTSMKIYNNLIKDLPTLTDVRETRGNRRLVRSSSTAKDEEVLGLTAQGYIAGTATFSRYMTADEYISYYNEIAGKMTGIV